MGIPCFLAAALTAISVSAYEAHRPGVAASCKKRGGIGELRQLRRSSVPGWAPLSSHGGPWQDGRGSSKQSHRL